jgi:hypothetical protein
MRTIVVVLVLVPAFAMAPLSMAQAPKGSGSASSSGSGSGSSSGSTKPLDPNDPNLFVTTNVLTGQLNNLNVDAKTFTLHVTTKVLVPNQQAQQDLVRAQQDLQRAALERNPQARAQKVADANNRIAQAQANLQKVEEKSQDVNMQMHDDMVVRTLNLPAFFDDKGNPRKPTDDELKELQQPPGTPGFKATITDIQNGQTVQVAIGHKKGEATAPKPPAGSGSGSSSAPPPPPPQIAILVLIGKSGK